MAKRNRLTEMEAYSVKKRKSEPVGARGKGTLLLERKAAGTISGYYRERVEGKDKRIYLGTLNRKPRSGTDELTLDAMRLAALRLSQTALEAGGLEHVKLSAAKQLHSSGEGSFGDLLDSYCDHLEQAGKVSARPVRRMLDAHVKAHHPALLRRPASKVRPEDIQLVLSQVLNRPPLPGGAGRTAKAHAANGMRTVCENLRLALQAAFSHAAKAHLSPERLATRGKTFAISSNPVRDIPAIRGARRAITESLTPDELGVLLRHLETLPEAHRAIAQALIYFGGQRIAQFCAVPWAAVTDSTISLLDSKGKKERPWEHILPITPRLTEIMHPLLQHRIGPGPFSLRESNTASPSSVMKIFGAAGQSLAASGKARPFSYRNVRVTAETLMAHLGISSEIRAWILSHGRSGVQAKHYDRYSYLPEKRAALERWGDYLDGLARGDAPADNVMLLSRNRKESDER
ncbi:TPA: tyrosine-type recombinase/integrase [Pseudomonas aeruginosa]|uniref:Phage integrase family protein n=2 Tax=Pseudomonas aeruginosa group TaxID=136841 RepID=A0A9P1R036_PSEAI|nr:integrase [Pseudomonas aeruginosa]ABR82267.2 phage integrase [Pseudomonas aeruginosa PA7]AKE66964.1 integrase [Pseudomonas aeruginosa]ARG53976.1 integrase [Pseudomonas aeruginosa]EIU2680993.1 integrase [Pseudomonas aeruginosa]EIU3424595.1 integrase [Pseudomonas aeruginosa]